MYSLYGGKNCEYEVDCFHKWNVGKEVNNVDQLLLKALGGEYALTKSKARVDVKRPDTGQTKQVFLFFSKLD